MLWCCKVEGEVWELSWAWVIGSKGLFNEEDILGLTTVRTCSLFSYPAIVSFSHHIFCLTLQTFSFQFFRLSSHRDHAEIPVSQLVAQFPPSTGRKWPRHLSASLHSSCSLRGWGQSSDNTSPQAESKGTDPATSDVLDRWPGTLPSETIPGCKLRERMEAGSPRWKKVALPALYVIPFRCFISQFPA